MKILYIYIDSASDILNNKYKEYIDSRSIDDSV